MTQTSHLAVMESVWKLEDIGNVPIESDSKGPEKEGRGGVPLFLHRHQGHLLKVHAGRA